MYSFSYLEPVCCSMSSSNCSSLTCIQISQEQVKWSGIPISLRTFQFVVIHTVKDFSVVSETEVRCFPGVLLLFLVIQWMLAIWSLVPLPFVNPAWTSGSSVEAWIGEFWALLCQQSSHLVKAMVFPVVMYGCESWTIKKAECRRIDAFELWY